MAGTKKTPAKKKKSTPAKKKAWDAKNYKSNGKTAGLIALGLAAGTFADSTLEGVTAIKDDRLKKAIPMVVGAAMVGMSNKTVSNIGIGMAVYGLYATTRKLVGLSGTENGAGLSEETKAMLNKFIPSLGNPNYPAAYSAPTEYYAMEPTTIDVAHEVVGESFAGAPANPYEGVAGMSAESYFGA